MDITLKQEAGPDYTSIIQSLDAVNAQPLWDRYKRITTREPQSSSDAQIWAWRDMQLLMDRAVEEVSMEDAERRVLLMTHPGLNGDVATTTNLLAGLQILEPGEYAAPHRHTIAALRFVMSGSGAATIVNGKHCPMAKGDLILTPSWAWHEHINEGPDRVVWFDGLDVPLVRHLDSMFLQFGAEGDARDESRRHLEPSEKNTELAIAESDSAISDTPQFCYPWVKALDALELLPRQNDGSRRLRYTNPGTGGSVMSTIDCYLLELSVMSPSVETRSTSNIICVVVEGNGVTRVGDKLIEWSPGDVFTLPHWQWVSHCAAQNSRIFQMTDRALLEKIGYLRDESRPLKFNNQGML